MSERVIADSGGHLESENCWCRPRVVQPCPECDGGALCWRCGGEGAVPKYDDSEPCVIVHTDEVRK